jgi:hypothetical protein
VDFYYVSVGNIVKSEAQIQEEEKQRKQDAEASEAAEIAREAQFNSQTHVAPPAQSEQSAEDQAASDEAYKALFPTPEPRLQ